MKLKYKYLLLSILFTLQTAYSQENTTAEIYLLTCGPGTEIYSVYGHSALKIVIPAKQTDAAYNWGVFDFNTPNFAWKFAKGKLNYSLGVSSYEAFLRDYFSESRWVISQKLNLSEQEIENLFRLLDENLMPENITYRYDFYYDNCSTRIRDLLEKAVGENMFYPPDMHRREMQTFRSLSGEYEKGYPWTKMGIDLLLGSPTDKKATFRHKMFLPVELKDGLSESLVRRDAKMIPLLQNPELVLDFPYPAVNTNILTSPLFIFSLLLIVIIIFTGLARGRTANTLIDIVLFTAFAILALMMLFFNFFTDHQQLRWNLNIIWLNPFVILCLISLIYNKNSAKWFRIVFFLAAGFLAAFVILPQHINNAYFPLIAIMIIRSSVRAGFRWNPLTLPYLTQL